ncbi:leukotriene B4 receptor 1-like [Mustelus asterias]
MELSNSTVSPPSVHQVVICVAFTLMFLVGMLGNLLVIWIILCDVKQRFPTVKLILNLAAADLTVLLTLPFWIYSFAGGWVFGANFCTVLFYVIHCNMFASVFFITAMSIERFVAVLYPFVAQKWWRSGTAGKVIVVIWVFALLCAVPLITAGQGAVDAEHSNCSQWNGSNQQHTGPIMFQISVGFALPFLTLSVCNVLVAKRIKQMTFRGKSKLMNVIRRVVIAFAVCWLPYHMTNMITISSILTKTSSPETSKALLLVREKMENFAGGLAVTNSCINPILYAFAARRFQDNFKTSGIVKLFQQLNSSLVENAPRNQISSEPIL